MAQPVKILIGDHEDPSSIPGTHIKTGAARLHPVSPVLRSRDRKFSGVCWPASQTKRESSRFRKKLFQCGGDWGRHLVLTFVLYGHTCTAGIYYLYGYATFVHPFICGCTCLHLLDGMKSGLCLFLFKCLVQHLFTTPFIIYLGLELTVNQQSLWYIS